MPSAIFWCGAYAALMFSDSSCWMRSGLGNAFGYELAEPNWLPTPEEFLNTTGNRQIAFILAAILVVTISGLIVKSVRFNVLRLAEGYWPLGRFTTWMTNRMVAKYDRLKDRRASLAPNKKAFDGLTIEDRRRYSELDRQLQAFWPSRSFLPTRLGNVMRAAENRPGERYGLDAIVLWPRLWLLIPDSSRSELATARGALDEASGFLLWAVLSLGLIWWSWWALPIGIVVAFASYQAMIRTAGTFGELLTATFDVHRELLYKSLRWPLPEDPSAEKESGLAITQYLWRGSSRTTPKFTAPKLEK